MGFRTVFIKDGEKLSLRLDNLSVRKNNEDYLIPLVDIETVILEGNQTVITSKILSAFSKYHIALVVCDDKYLPTGMYLGKGQYYRSAKRAMWQAKWKEIDKQLVWKEIVYQKILNQIQVLQNVDIELNSERSQILIDYLENIMIGDSTNREGHAAKVYFNSLFGNGFSRKDTSFVNFCLDYGYAIIRAQMARSVSALGLIPELGVFHKNEYNAYNLADDLMEPFRPIVDYLIVTNILKKSEKHLTYDIRLEIIDFLNHEIKINNKKFFIMQAIHDYVQSFIKAMENENYSQLLDIQVNNIQSR
ncbi:type II CRISPR-associated endonuclease Cas1 [Nosocomiicoccus sp. HMSC059G07]|uniref:type II CRISPR-associated endonuclease Cas1 n=1 Tax=Nosocomiicoccus sp. HMSC059G07 TaxID=1739531 RepID=UPI0008A12CE3|nr:type II CRISPR-associated endonuclease Cas1 [Nosocomiicoccus sp. HMSC059G07]OFO49718.1 subtype II CRISPR-associated endonuclease Cas1 [Nosocomiicoccus sp. HMSC059G07]